jgi:hypothetical protein
VYQWGVHCHGSACGWESASHGLVDSEWPHAGVCISNALASFGLGCGRVGLLASGHRSSSGGLLPVGGGSLLRWPSESAW